MSASVFYESRNRAYARAVKLLQGGTEADANPNTSTGQYIVNNEKLARTRGKMLLRMAQSSLISIIPITQNTSSYLMNVTENTVNLGNTGILPDEIRLKLQDVFFTSALGFFIIPLTALSGAYTQSHFQFMTFPDPAMGFPGSGITSIDALLGLWTSARLEVKVGGEIVTPNWWLQRHAVINQTMSGVGGVPANPFWNQQNFAEDGYLITEPNWIINGGNNNEYTVRYGSDYSQIWNGNTGITTQLGIAIVWDGWLAQNASAIMNNAPAS